MSEQGLVVDRSIPFVDTHHHLWELARLSYAWLSEPEDADATPLGDYRAICTDWGPQRLFREFYGQNVIKSIHVEAAMSGPDPVAETEWLDSVSREHGMPNALTVACDLSGPDAADQLDRHLETSELVRSVRMLALPDDTDAGFRAGMKALRDRGLSFDLNPPPGHLEMGVEMVRRFPDVAFVVGHTGAPQLSEADGFDAWSTHISELADAENVTCKISGMGMYDHAWTIERIRPFVLHSIEAFGTERAMFGTNWPVDVLYASYFEQVDAYRIILADASYSSDDQHALLHGNAERIYRI